MYNNCGRVEAVKREIDWSDRGPLFLKRQEYRGYCAVWLASERRLLPFLYTVLAFGASSPVQRDRARRAHVFLQATPTTTT